MVMLCASLATGAFIGVVIDHAHVVQPGVDGVEKWLEVQATSGVSPTPIQNSLTGVYLQVLPDDQDNYAVTRNQASFTQTYVSFDLFVETEGVHTLFARWSGGDAQGGGDSMYAVMVDASGEFVPGLPTVREAMVPIQNSGTYNGCCYDAAKTHSCVCVAGDLATECAKIAPGSVPIDKVDAQGFGAQCPAGFGQVDRVLGPLWYEFAGGNVLDFDASDPWDVTCEAEGIGTSDSGRDAAQWNLKAGTSYELRFYVREDGTAFEAFYLAGPSAKAPKAGFTVSAGSSTTCPPGFSPSSSSSSSSKKSSSSSDDANLGVALGITIPLLLLAALAGAFFWTRQQRPSSSSGGLGFSFGNASDKGFLELSSHNDGPPAMA